MARGAGHGSTSSTAKITAHSFQNRFTLSRSFPAIPFLSRRGRLLPRLLLFVLLRGALSQVPPVQRRQAEPRGGGETLPLRLRRGAVVPDAELLEEQPPQGVLPRPRPDIPGHACLIPNLQGVEPPPQGVLQRRNIRAALAGLAGKQDAAEVLFRLLPDRFLHCPEGIFACHLYL